MPLQFTLPLGYGSSHALYAPSLCAAAPASFLSQLLLQNPNGPEICTHLAAHPVMLLD
jgi:hypothetical protein